MVQEPHVAPGIQHHGRVVMWATWPQTVLGIMVILLRCIFAGTKNGRWRWDCYWAVFALVSKTIKLHIFDILTRP